MISFIYSDEKTNSYRPEPWNYTKTPFPALRWIWQSHNAFLATAQNYSPDFDKPYSWASYWSPNVVIDKTLSKLIKTKEKWTNLIIPVNNISEDEKILLLTLRWWFRWYYSKVQSILNWEIIDSKTSSKHCVEVRHIIARIKDEASYILAETGRRSWHGIVEIFWWDFYQSMTSDEYKWLVDIYQESSLEVLRNQSKK